MDSTVRFSNASRKSRGGVSPLPLARSENVLICLEYRKKIIAPDMWLSYKVAGMVGKSRGAFYAKVRAGARKWSSWWMNS